MSAAFLRASDVRSTGNQRWLLCQSSQLSLPLGYFPPAIETDMGNGAPFQLDRPIFDEDGSFLGVTYRQNGGSEILVFLD